MIFNSGERHRGRRISFTHHPTPALEGGGAIFLPFFGGMPTKNGVNLLPFLPVGGRGRGMEVKTRLIRS